jgi:hypothetical protein
MLSGFQHGENGKLEVSEKFIITVERVATK